MNRPLPPKRRRRRAPSTPPAPVHDLDGMLRRLHLPTVRRLYADLATRAEGDGMSYHTYLETLIAEEIAHRAETRLTRAVRAARLPFLRTIDEFNFTFQAHSSCRCWAAISDRSSSARAGVRSSPARAGWDILLYLSM